ncbi:MAG: CDP-diacylglycerol--serine O-phosphatidyltransferase [Acidobacteria bacterium RIFCSPLOWO2_02_FULL_67_21]|nr:MAG: CDP-diacylglycerol--serine O-phosphatidyltransferase [Acidobacteria bacterium RIFCSPLOWO2_02_FULL_67_21]
MNSDDLPRSRIRMLTPLRRRTDVAQRRLRRGVYLLPSLFTLGNMFCGYACIVYAMRGEYVTAAPFIGLAIVVDMLDGRIARMTGTTSAFGIEFDSLADIISFGLAPAILAFAWGLQPLGRLGWAAGFIFVAAAAVRLARFNIQAGSHDKRYFVGMPSPAAAGVPAATVYAYPWGMHAYAEALPVLAMVIVPALLMVSTIRFRSFKNLDFGVRRSYPILLLFAIGLALLAAKPEVVLVVLAYSYLASAFAEMVWHRARRRHDHVGHDAPASEPGAPETNVTETKSHRT